jgi:hypothetical protein
VPAGLLVRSDACLPACPVASRPGLGHGSIMCLSPPARRALPARLLRLFEPCARASSACCPAPWLPFRPLAACIRSCLEPSLASGPPRSPLRLASARASSRAWPLAALAASAACIRSCLAPSLASGPPRSPLRLASARASRRAWPLAALAALCGLHPLVPRAELLPLATSPFSSLSLAPDVELRHAAAKPAASGRPSRLRAHLCSCASRRASVASGRPSRPRGACALGAHPRSCLAPSCRPLATQVYPPATPPKSCWHTLSKLPMGS